MSKICTWSIPHTPIPQLPLLGIKVDETPVNYFYIYAINLTFLKRIFLIILDRHVGRV